MDQFPFADNPTAALIVIGNEILSGRTQDVHVKFLGQRLNARGIILKEVRVILDDRTTIIETVNSLRKTYDYVFTTGGIGSTHDDITADSLAQAFGVPLTEHRETAVEFRKFMVGKNMSESFMRMALMPEGAEPLKNPVAIAPGFKMHNVFVLPGVPTMMHPMFDDFVAPHLKPGKTILSKTISTKMIRESFLSADLEDIQKANPLVEIGSYPVYGDDPGVNLVVRGCDPQALDAAADAIILMLKKLGDPAPHLLC